MSAATGTWQECIEDNTVSHDVLLPIYGHHQLWVEWLQTTNNSCFFGFVFFFVRKKIWDNRSREWLNGFWWNFYQTIPGKMEFAMSCRRLANVDDLRNLRYDSGAITRGRHERRLCYKIMSARMDLIQLILIIQYKAVRTTEIRVFRLR